MECDVRRLTRKFLASNHERLAMDVLAVEMQEVATGETLALQTLPLFNPISTCCAECFTKVEQPHGKYT